MQRAYEKYVPQERFPARGDGSHANWQLLAQHADRRAVDAAQSLARRIGNHSDKSCGRGVPGAVLHLSGLSATANWRVRPSPATPDDLQKSVIRRRVSSRLVELAVRRTVPAA